MNLYSLEPVAKYLKESRSQFGFPQTMSRKPLTYETNFFASPVSEYEERKRRFNDEYNSYVRQKDQSGKRPPSRTPEPKLYSSSPKRDFATEPRITKKFEAISTYVPLYKSELLGPAKQPRDPNIFVRPPVQERHNQPVKALESFSSKYEAPKGKRSPEPVEEYFPFGKPGAGAPYRDSNGRPIGDRKHFLDAARTMMDTNKAYKEQSPETDFLDERQMKERQKEELRRSLQEQIENKRIMEEEMKRRRIIEDMNEQARIERQLKEIDSDIRREVMEGEMSRTIEDPPPDYIVQQKVNRPIRSEFPPKQIDQYKKTARSSKPLRQSKFDAYRLVTEADKQTSSIKDMIDQLKEERKSTKNFALQAINELEAMKESLHIDSYNDQRKSRKAMYLPNTDPVKRWYSSDTKFVPMARIGKTVVHPPTSSYSSYGGWGRPIVVQQDYSGVESPEAKLQLSKLDELLKSTMKEPEYKEDEFDRATEIQEHELARSSSRLITQQTFDDRIAEKADENAELAEDVS